MINCNYCQREILGHKRRYCNAKCRLAYWNRKNKDKLQKAQIKYRKTHIDLCRLRTRLNQRKLNNQKRFSGNRLLAIKKSDGKCYICKGDKKRLIVHHKDKNKQNNNLSNLQVLCQPCHAGLHYIEDKRTHNKNGDFNPII